MGHHEHKHQAPQRVSLEIITVSDSRTLESDGSGMLIEKMLCDNGHTVTGRRVVSDSGAEIKRVLLDAAKRDADAIILNGGTGIAKRDNTIDVLTPLLANHLPGFGELFRMLSYSEIGSSAMMSRALAGTVESYGQKKVVIALPGSTGACRLAMEKLILPEIGHMILEANK